MKKLFSIKALITILTLLLSISLSASEVSEDCLAKYTLTVETAETILVSMEKEEYGNIFEYNELLKISIEVSKQSCRYDESIMLGLEGLENQTYMIDSVLSKIEN